MVSCRFSTITTKNNFQYTLYSGNLTKFTAIVMCRIKAGGGDRWGEGGRGSCVVARPFADETNYKKSTLRK